MSTPNITVINDYDNAFLSRVESAINLANEKSQEIKYKEIEINSGPYRPYCLGYTAQAETIKLDFYSAARVFGFQHTIADITEVLTGINQ